LTWELTLRKGVKFHTAAVRRIGGEVLLRHMLDPNLKSPSKTNHTFVKSVEIIAISRCGSSARAFRSRQPAHLPAHAAAEYLASVGSTATAASRSAPDRIDWSSTCPTPASCWSASTAIGLGRSRSKTIVYRPIKEDATRVGALLAGEVDLALDIPSELIPTVTASPRQGETVSSTRVFIMGMSNLDPSLPTAKAPVREPSISRSTARP